MQSLQIQHVCKHGTKEGCCRYLLFGAKGFECGKISPTMKKYRDQLVKDEKIRERADNCEGDGGAVIYEIQKKAQDYP